MKYRAVLFDMGNTLVEYFTREQWPGVLEEAIAECVALLRPAGLLRVAGEELARRVQEARGEQPDNRVRPLAGRLREILGIADGEVDARTEANLCRAFMKPVFARGRVYNDVLPTLAELRLRGVRTAIVSNTPWGSPGALWREEMRRFGLLDAVDAAVFCTDVGWRKPAEPIFRHALAAVEAEPGEALFIGDDPRWDVAGPASIGMDALLIDRWDRMRDADVLCGLGELIERL